MAVVINEFEVLPAAPAPGGTPHAAAAADETAPKEKPDPCAVAAAVRTLRVHSLRAWAH